ncbi:MAG: ribbon-helix-helix domain-containing protein [Candidatus Bathyarchaeia archaeon]
MNVENEMPKQRVTVSISKDVLEWIDSQVEKRIFKDRSHAFEKLIYDKMQEQKEKKQ